MEFSYFVGLDVHKKSCTACVLDARGAPVMRHKIISPWPNVVGFLAQFKGQIAVCFEASTGYGYLHDLLRKVAAHVVVAHPGKLRLIFRSKRKNDRIDAERLAKLLFLGEVPAVYVPCGHVRAWRSMIEHRGRLVEERTAVKNQIRALLRTEGVPHRRGLWSAKGRQWLRELSLSEPLYEIQRDTLLERLQSLDKMIRRVSQELNRRACSEPAVALLKSIPGVGNRTAEAVAAYIADPTRFQTAHAVASYFGLVPSQDASGDRNRLGHITRQGPPLVRRMLVQAAWQGIRRCPQIRAYFERIERGDHERRKIALVATAHYLLRMMQAMLTTGQMCRFMKASEAAVETEAA